MKGLLSLKFDQTGKNMSGASSPSRSSNTPYPPLTTRADELIGKMGPPMGPQYVAHGSFGCVIRGVKTCDEGDTTQLRNTANGRITKLFKNKESFNIELKEAQKVAEIDKNHDFTVQMFNSCLMSSKTFGDALFECKWSKRIVEDVPYGYFLTIEYADGGMDLANVIRNLQKMKNRRERLNQFILLWRAAASIFSGLSKLIPDRENADREPTFHNDIKPPNITYHEQNKKMYLVDWGLSTSGKGNRGGSGSFMYMSPEILAKRVLDQKLEMDEFTDITMKMLETGPFVLVSCENLFELEANKSSNHIITRLLSKNKLGVDIAQDDETKLFNNPINMHKSDTYAWGMSLVELFTSAQLYPLLDTDSEEEKNFCYEVVSLILSMIRLDPLTRITATLAHKNYLRTIKRLDKKELYNNSLSLPKQSCSTCLGRSRR